MCQISFWMVMIFSHMFLMSQVNFFLQGLRKFLEANPVEKKGSRKGRENEPLKKTTRNKLVRLVIKREKDWQLKDVPAEQQLETFR